MQINAQTRRATHSAFTLVELLVVIAVIALLIALTLPVVNRTIERGRMVDCLSKLRQIAAASISYADDNRYRMPHPNWGVQSQGWLYTQPIQQVLGNQPAPNATEPQFQGPSTGTLWTYLGGERNQLNAAIADVYRCPSHNSFEENTTELITSFIFNGSLSNYRAAQTVAFRIDQFRPDAIFAWEAQTREDRNRDDEIPNIGDSWNDGGSQPLEGLTTRHAQGATTAAIDGSSAWIKQEDWLRWQQETPGKLWNVPQTGTTNPRFINN